MMMSIILDRELLVRIGIMMVGINHINNINHLNPNNHSDLVVKFRLQWVILLSKFIIRYSRGDEVAKGTVRR